MKGSGSKDWEHTLLRGDTASRNKKNSMIPSDCKAANPKVSSEKCDKLHKQQMMSVSDSEQQHTAAVFFVGNKLMLDEGVGPAAYEALLECYDAPDNVLLFDVGCMSMDMLPYVRDCDVILTVDAVDGTGEPPGTVFRFPPDAMARQAGARASLHDLKLADLFDAAFLLGYEAEGYCLGMQVENMSPAEYTVGLTPKVHAALPLLVETVVAELHHRGFMLVQKEEGNDRSSTV